MKKPVWLLANPNYQYQNFKEVIDYSGWDYLCMFKGNNITKAEKGLFDLEGNEVNPEELKDKYSVIILTSSNVLPNHIDILQIAEQRKIIQISHGILGTTVDNVAGVPTKSKNKIYGVYPKAWESLWMVQERLKKTNNAFAMKTHPYMVKIQEPLKTKTEKGSLGLLMSNCSGPGAYCKKILNGLKKRGIRYNTIYVKRHPLAKSNSIKIFEPLLEYADNIEYYDKDSDKNEFFDKCETLVIGMSSTFAESHLRNNFFNKKQKIYGLNEWIRVGLTDIQFSTRGVDFCDWETAEEYKEWHQFDSMLELTEPDKIFDDFIQTINKITDSFNDEHVKDLNDW